jgi:hypothetical protein
MFLILGSIPTKVLIFINKDIRKKICLVRFFFVWLMGFSLFCSCYVVFLFFPFISVCFAIPVKLILFWNLR